MDGGTSDIDVAEVFQDSTCSDARNEESSDANRAPGVLQLRLWLNKTLRIEMTDGRVLIGTFLCTDRDANVILGSCSEFLPQNSQFENEEPRMLGLVMIPGKHIVRIHIDLNDFEDQSLDLSSSVDSNEIL